MTLSQLFLTSLLLLVSGLLVGGWLSTRAKAETINYWPLAWAALMATGGVRLSPLPNRLEIAIATLFGAFMIAGSLQYAGRAIPRHFFATTASLGVVAAVVSFTELHPAVRATSYGFNFSAVLFSAALVHPIAMRENRAWIHKAIGPGLLLLSLVFATDYFNISTDETKIGPWLFVAVPLATLQIVSLVERVQERALNAKNALEQSVSLLKATLDSTADGILVVDRDGKISNFNDTFASMWHIPEAVLDRRNDDEALAYAMTQLKDPNAFFEKVKDLYEHPDDESFDTLEFADGRVFERYSRPQVLGEDIVGRVWSFRDVTERVRAQEVATRHQNHLEELIEEGTRELTRSRDNLRQADRLVAVGTLAAGVAHQINNPVGVILNSAQYALLCEQEADAKETFKRALEVNAAEARRCADIVRSMLQFAREQPVDTRIEDLNQVVQRACRATDSYARDHAAQIFVELADTSLPVRMSAIEIEQVVVNLVRNGIESRDTGARVEVRAVKCGDVAQIRVADNGRGIAAQDRGRIFDPFYSTRLQEGGTGLGLSVVHGIVNEHKGVISTESVEGQGTVFLVELPVDPSSPA